MVKDPQQAISRVQSNKMAYRSLLQPLGLLPVLLGTLGGCVTGQFSYEAVTNQDFLQSGDVSSSPSYP